MNAPLVVYFLQETASHGATHGGSLWETVVQSNFFNFIVAAILLTILVVRFRLFSFIGTRQTQIAQELQAAETRRDQALKELQEIETRTASLGREVDEILKEAETSAQTMADMIIRQAEADAAALVANAQKRISLEEQTAARDLERRLMQEAIHGAGQLLESTLSKEDKIRSVEDFIATLPELYQKELAR